MKPQWAVQLRLALELERQAEKVREVALSMRCPEEESGGARCTADWLPIDHAHRIREEDLP